MPHIRLATAAACGFVALVGVIASASSVRADDSDHSTIDGRTQNVLAAMNQFLRDRQQFRFDASITYDRELESGQLLEVHESHQVAVQRPGSLRATVLGDDGARLAFVHSGTVTIVDPIRQKYFQAGVPDDLDGAVDVMVIDLGLALPSADFVSGDPVKSLTSRSPSSRYVGISMIDGTACHHMAFAEDGLEWQLWVSAEMQPVPRRITIQYVDRPRNPRFIATLDWAFDSIQYPDTAFEFTASEDMTRVEDPASLGLPGGEE